MIYTSDINQLISNIPIKNIMVYLDDLGWKHKKTTRDEIIKVYSAPSELENAYVTVPRDKNMAGYKSSMKDLVNSIAEVYKKDFKQVIIELLNPNADILKFRVISKENENGVIGLGKGLDLFNNAKNMLWYAARDAIEYKQIYRGGRSNVDIGVIIDACQIGQTEIGSFVVPIICPFYDVVDGKIQQLTLFDKSEFNTSKTRKATTQLMLALSKIKRAVTEQDINLLANPESGISFNFFESLTKIGIANDDCQVEIKAEWSPITPNNDVVENVILSNTDEYDAIQSTIKNIKKFEQKTESFIGKIRDLKSNPEKRDTGGVFTLIYVGEEDKTTSTKFAQSAELHNLAIEAYQKNVNVKVIASRNSDNGAWNCEGIEIIN